MSFFFSLFFCFSPETNHFVPVSILLVILEYSLYIYYFSRFFSNPDFKFHTIPVA